jgi:hypothetical protein
MVLGLGLNEIIRATRTIEKNAYWIALVFRWMQTLGSQPIMPKIALIIGTKACLNPKESIYVVLPSNLAQDSSILCLI